MVEKFGEAGSVPGMCRALWTKAGLVGLLLVATACGEVMWIRQRLFRTRVFF